MIELSATGCQHDCATCSQGDNIMSNGVNRGADTSVRHMSPLRTGLLRWRKLIHLHLPGKIRNIGEVINATLLIPISVSLAVAAGSAIAQDYPTKPLRIIVASASGGAPDIAARGLANELGLQVGQQVVIDNRPGAGGIIGWELLARAAPDGYTFGYISNAFATNPSLYARLPYDSTKDFQPVVSYGSNSNLLTVTPSLPVRSLMELVELAQRKPGTLSYGSSGNGTSMHLSMELLKAATAINMVHVSYKGIPQAHTDIISGQIHAICDVVYTILPHFKAGRVRALAVTSLKRSPVAPEIPTFDESGIKDYELTNWSGYSFPARTPRNLVLRLNAEINKALSSPSVMKALEDRGSVVAGGTPEQFAEFLRREAEKWEKVIKAAGIKPQ